MALPKLTGMRKPKALASHMPKPGKAKLGKVKGPKKIKGM